jgi:hypothetical protein
MGRSKYTFLYHSARNRKFVDSPLEESGLELVVSVEREPLARVFAPEIRVIAQLFSRFHIISAGALITPLMFLR